MTSIAPGRHSNLIIVLPTSKRACCYCTKGSWLNSATTLSLCRTTNALSSFYGLPFRTSGSHTQYMSAVASTSYLNGSVIASTLPTLSRARV